MMNIIVGGTHGLGKEIALALQEQGQDTFVVGRSYDEAIHGEGAQVDLASAEESLGLAQKVKELGEKALLSFWWVSGYGYNGDFTEQQKPEVMAAVNFGNVLPAAHAAFSAMVEHPEVSHFVVVSSTTGFKARKDEAVYAGTKHAQVGFTRSLGLEAERLGVAVKVALFMPGGIKTPFWDGNQPTSYNEFLEPAKVAEHVVKQVLEQEKPLYEEVIERGSL
jgi:short-subunit dehydrogenase